MRHSAFQESRLALALLTVCGGLTACGLPGEGAHIYACYGVQDVCRATDPWTGECTWYDAVPTERRVCADHADASSTCDRYTDRLWSYGLLEENGCRPHDVDSSREPLMASITPDVREATIVPSSSWVTVHYEDKQGTAPILPNSSIAFIDDAGPGSYGNLVITDLEVYGGPTEVDGHSIEQPTLMSAEHFSGTKDPADGFSLRTHSVSTATFGYVDGDFTSFLGLGQPVTTGAIDYAAGRIELTGSLRGNSVDGDLPITADFHLEFSFPPVYSFPFLLDYFFFYGNEVGVEVVELEDDTVVGYEWFAGAPHLLGDLEFEKAKLGTGYSVELPEGYLQEYTDVTLLLRLESGGSLMHRFCLDKGGECDSEEQSNGEE